MCIKIDGDGQMDTKNIPKFLNPFEKNKYIYVKGNRFHFHKNFLKMPIIRVFGNFFYLIFPRLLRDSTILLMSIMVLLLYTKMCIRK